MNDMSRRINQEWLEERYYLSNCESERWYKEVKASYKDAQESNDYE
jgi:hypothetical protein